MELKRHSLLLFTFTLSLISNAPVQSITVDLIRRDSPRSPFFDASQTRFDRVAGALRRSVSRADTLALRVAGSLATQSARGSVTPGRKSQVTASSGEYLLNVSLGTPPVNILAIADTGSDLTWTQCAPCDDCYRQIAPLFDPKRSSTYEALPCDGQGCNTLVGTSCGDNGCEYSVKYGDKSVSYGVLSTEKLVLGSSGDRPLSLPAAIFGCGFSNKGTFGPGGSGIIGLGGGDVSTITQMKSLIGGKFSYCLIPSSDEKDSSTMNFGPEAVVSGPGTVSTPIVTRDITTFYYLTLESFTVGEKTIPFNAEGGGAGAAGEGNIIIDSGTTLTIIPSDVYSELESAVGEKIELPRVTVQNFPGLCYRTQGNLEDAPQITARFSGGADVKLGAVNNFIRVAEDVVCLAFLSSSTSISIFGNMAQTNLLVGYDLIQGSVSFKPTDCSKL